MEATPDNGLRIELERMRAGLLDLSARNSLLNYTHPRASSLRIVDEVPALVLESLISDGGFRFAPLKSPTGEASGRRTERSRWTKSPRVGTASNDADLGISEADDPTLLAESDRERREAAKAARARREVEIRALAESLGINPSYDLPAVEDSEELQHADNRLQTLLTPDELEVRLQKMHASAVTAIQESGANMLHLLFGFIEWADVQGGKTRMAPLVLVPATLDRLELDAATHTYPYKVTASGEDWSTNVTLIEKCRKDFGFVIPSIEPEENLETYFARIDVVLRSAPPDWRVRRQLTLGLVSFGKILMWRDLDPATWPAARPLLGNALLRQVLGADDSVEDDADYDAVTATRTTEYNIDNLPASCGTVPPIVVAADSSQHSVLVDVQRGDNLVVQGPPGTGKSQTITNIIAGAIAARKKILFVAEKRAALEVVARRLIDSGLGPFCLPLHSHTSNKREFLDGLQERIAIRRANHSADEANEVEGLLHETREVLTGHVERLHAPFGSLGDTAYTIFWRTRRLASELPEQVIASLRGVTIPSAVSVNPSELARRRADLRALGASFTAVAADIPLGETHPWHGVTRGDLRFDDAEAVVALARQLRGLLADAEDARCRLETLTGAADWPEDVEALHPLVARCEMIDPPLPTVDVSLIQAIHDGTGVESVRAAVAAANAARCAWEDVSGPWGEAGLLSSAGAAGHAAVLDAADRMFATDRTLAFYAETASLLQSALDRLAAADVLGRRLTAELRVVEKLPLGVALHLIEIAAAVEGLPDGALDLRSPALRTAGAIDKIALLAARGTSLKQAADEYDARFAVSMRPRLTDMRNMLGSLTAAPKLFPSLFSRAYRKASAGYRRMAGGREADRVTMTAELDALVRHVTDYEAFEHDRLLSELFGAAANGVSSPFAAAIALLTWAKRAVSAVRGTGEPGRTISEAVWSAPSGFWLDAAGVLSGAPTTAEAANRLRGSFDEIAARVSSAEMEWTTHDADVVLHIWTEWRDVAVSACDTIRASGGVETTGIGAVRHKLGLVQRAWTADAVLARHTATFRELGIGLPGYDPASDADPLVAIQGALLFLGQFEHAELSAPIVNWLVAADPARRLSDLKRHAREVDAALSAVTTGEAQFSHAAGAETRKWYQHTNGGLTLRYRGGRFDRAINASGSLGRYVSFLRIRGVVARSPMPVACALLESAVVSGEQLPDVYDYLLARTLAEHVLRERPELDQFSGALHDTRRAQFIALDERYLSLTQRVIAEHANEASRVPGNSYGQVRELTEEGLIRHEIDKTRRHIPIREMFKRAGRAIQALKPCIMMGPQAVAQYLPPGLFHFDIVIMDEASQMRPEDALGAIARGSQLIVVGDPRQLGPTSFFATQSDDEEDIDETAATLVADAVHSDPERLRNALPPGASVLQRSESILIAAARRYPMRMLRWHYRSRYPQLIEFSNQEFYGKNLVLFPHPGTEREGDGLNFRAVDEAIYSSSINRKEAADVVDAVRRHATENPERTLLVVTMNQPQRELIDTLIQSAEKDDAGLAAFRARHEGTLEPFDVKNLENVQGDERDVIFVSVTYGPNDRGSVAQNFGPVSTIGGERRLNVLFTRAKFRLDVFCSFDPTMLRVTDLSPRGLVVLRDYLRYAKEGTLAGGRYTAKEPDSDFEIEVARALGSVGYIVQPQVGVAGYFLDMAVVDPQHPGRYLLAVECDGATYHSAKSARDRDRLRQGVLEGLGWNVHRVWSTDWFRDPRGETTKIVRRIEGLLQS